MTFGAADWSTLIESLSRLVETMKNLINDPGPIVGLLVHKYLQGLPRLVIFSSEFAFFRLPFHASVRPARTRSDSLRIRCELAKSRLINRSKEDRYRVNLVDLLCEV